jgi:hypothetical protein
MKRVCAFSLASCVALLLFTGVVSAQGAFTFGFSASGSDLPAPDLGTTQSAFDANALDGVRNDGPDWPAGALGAATVATGGTGQGTYFATIEQGDAGATAGAQGWQMAFTASGCGASIIAATVTQTDLAPGTIEDEEAGPGGSGGFDATELTSGEGNAGAVSAIVLHLKKGTTLDPTGSNAKPATGPELNPLTVCRFLVESDNPAGGGDTCTVTLAYQDGLQGSGQPIDNKVTQDGQSVVPTVNSAALEKTGEIPPCDQQAGAYGLGFSDAALDTADYYDAGLAGTLGAGGSVSVEHQPGETPSATVYQCITVGSGASSPQGWQLSTALSGAADITAVTLSGTSAEGALSSGFSSTSVVDSADNGGTEGFISGVVLHLKKGSTLNEATAAETGTAAVVAITVSGEAVQDVATVSATLSQQDGLIGGGQAIDNKVTADGGSQSICNTADVTIEFAQGIVNPEFRRGDTNDDGKNNLADAVWILNESFRMGTATPCQKAADANDDGTVDAIVDAAYIIAYQFESGSAPPAPFGACGEDPTADALDCPPGSMSQCP